MSKISRSTTSQNPNEYIVSVNSSDSNPNFLASKLNAGDNVTLTTESVGGELVITVAATSPTTTLADLTDTNVSGVSDGEALIYESSSTKWIPGTLSVTYTLENISQDTTVSTLKDIFTISPTVAYSGSVTNAVLLTLPDPADHSGKTVKVILNEATDYSSETSSDVMQFGQLATAAGQFIDDFNSLVSNLYLATHRESVELFSTGTNWKLTNRERPTSARFVDITSSSQTIQVRNETDLFVDIAYDSGATRNTSIVFPVVGDDARGDDTILNIYLDMPIDNTASTELITTITNSDTTTTITNDTYGDYLHKFHLKYAKIDGTWQEHVDATFNPRDAVISIT